MSRGLPVVVLWSALLALSCGGGAGPVEWAAVEPAAVRRAVAASAGVLDARVVPLAYDLVLRIEPDAPGYTGRVRVELDVAPGGAPLERVRLYACAQVVVVAATLDALPTTWQAGSTPCVLEVDAPAPLSTGTHVLELAFGAAWSTERRALFRFEEGGRSYVASHMGESYLREAVPAFDEPAFKAPWTVALEVPEGLVALANAPLVEATPVASGSALPAADGSSARDATLVRHHFAPTPPMASYLVALVVGPWELHAAQAGAVPLRVVVPAGREGWQHALERTPALLEALTTYLDEPYPFAKLDLVAVPEIDTLAMENPGLVMAKASSLLVEAGADLDARRYAEWIIAHELAHMWFGNTVTMAWWDELWLNEAFATWLGSRVVETVGGEYEQPARDLDDRHVMMAQDVWPVRAVSQAVAPDAASIQAAFALQTYFKGASIMDMLEAWLGPDAMRDGLRRYVRAQRWGSATREALLEAFVPHAPEHFEDVLVGFLDAPGVPRLDLDWSCTAGTLTLAPRVARHVPLGASVASAPEAARDWSVPACLRLGSADGAQPPRCVVLEDAVPAELAVESCPAWLHPAASELAYYRWSLPPEDLAALLEAAALLDAAELGALPEQLWGAFEAGRLELPALLEALERIAQLPALPPLAVIATVEALERLAPLPAAQALGLSTRAAALLAALEAALPQAPEPGSLTERAREAVLDARVAVADDTALATAALASLESYLATGGDADTDWDATSRALRRAAAVADGMLAARLHELYGSLCSDWTGTVLGRLRGEPAAAASRTLLDCPLLPGAYLETLRRNPPGARAVFETVTASPGWLSGSFPRVSLAVHAGAAACTEPAVLRALVRDAGADPADERLARPLEQAARCHALDAAAAAR